MSDARIERSASTWQQPTPSASSPARTELVDRLVEMIEGLGPRRVRVAIDGRTAAGKTSLGHELAEGLARGGRTVLRASLDDFKRPWSEAHRHDRLSGEGYYRNAFDYGAVRALLLEPANPSGDGRVALCSIDPLTQIDHSASLTAMPGNGVLIVDGVFACRPEIDPYWDLRIWVEIDAELPVRRGTARDARSKVAQTRPKRCTGSATSRRRRCTSRRSTPGRSSRSSSTTPRSPVRGWSARPDRGRRR
jgi:uridine kinase